MTQLSGYILLEKIGSSALGALYKAKDTASGSLVALKVLQLGLLDDVSSDEMDARLQRDFEMATRLQHPGIARVFEIRREGRTALIASELVEGPTITSLIQPQTGSDISQVVAAAVQLLEALDFAHAQAVIHRDVKPSNVLIQGGGIKITDFGMADLAARHRYDTGALVGETEYMAPEQFLSGTIDRRCDIHAVGTLLYELLTGKSPFRGDPHTAAAMLNVLQLVPPPPSEVRRGLSSAFDRVVARALAKSPAQRFVTAREFRNELVASYVALMGRPPPETLVPVTPTPAARGQEDATVIQRVRTLQTLSAVTPQQAAGSRAPDGIAPGDEPRKPPPTPAVELFGPLPPAPLTAPVVCTPAAPPDAELAEPVLAEEFGAEALGDLAYGGAELLSPTRAAASGSLLPHELVRQALAVNAMLAQPAGTERFESGRIRAPEGATFYPGEPASPVAAPGLRSKSASMSARPAPIASPPIEPQAPPDTAPCAESPTGPMSTRAASSAPKRIIPLTDASIAHGGRVLAHFIGPIAMVFSRRAAQDAHDERAYFELLAAHLQDPDERRQFFRKVRRRSA